MSGYRTWTPGEIITASNVQEYLQDQTVMVFGSDSVRSTAIPVPVEGQLTWLQDDDKYQYYDGASWTDLIQPITGGTAGQPYVSNGGTAFASFRDMGAEYITTTITNKTAAYTAVAGDTNTVLNSNASSNVTFTFPDIMPTVGDRIDVVRNGAGTVTLAAGTGVTSWAGSGTAGTGAVFTMDVQYTAASVLKTGSGEYRVIGRVVI